MKKLVISMLAAASLITAASASDAMQQILTRGDTRNISESSVEYEVREIAYDSNHRAARNRAALKFNQKCARQYALDKK